MEATGCADDILRMLADVPRWAMTAQCQAMVAHLTPRVGGADDAVRDYQQREESRCCRRILLILIIHSDALVASSPPLFGVIGARRAGGSDGVFHVLVQWSTVV